MFETSLDAHFISHAQDPLAIHERCCITLDAHDRQPRSLPLFFHKVTHFAAHLRLDLLAHGSSIQNLCPAIALALEASITPLASRKKPFVHKVLACQVIASIDSKEILPHV